MAILQESGEPVMKKMISLMDAALNLLENPSPVVEGIYFSHHSGKFFEAVVKKGYVKPKYTCGGFGPKVPAYIFRLQCSILDYDLIMEYEK